MRPLLPVNVEFCLCVCLLVCPDLRGQITRKPTELRGKLLWGAYRKVARGYRMVTSPMTSRDPSTIKLAVNNEDGSNWERLCDVLSCDEYDKYTRPIYGCPKHFRELLSTPAVTFPEFFNGLLLRSILLICVQKLKFVALPLPEIMGGVKKFGSPWIHTRSLFSKILNGLLFGWTCEFASQVWSP